MLASTSYGRAETRDSTHVLMSYGYFIVGRVTRFIRLVMHAPDGSVLHVLRVALVDFYRRANVYDNSDIGKIYRCTDAVAHEDYVVDVQAIIDKVIYTSTPRPDGGRNMFFCTYKFRSGLDR